MNLVPIAFGLAAGGAGIGIGTLVAHALDSMARQPEMQSKLQATMLLGIAFVEVLALLGFVLCFIL